MSLTGIPPMGCLPLERTTNYVNGNGDKCMDGYNDVALHFNAKLGDLAKKMNDEMLGIRVVFSNPYDVFMQIIREPSTFGFEVASVACCATGMFEMGYLCDELNPFTCTDANKYSDMQAWDGLVRIRFGRVESITEFSRVGSELKFPPTLDQVEFGVE
ncbi:GDSL esterase/lipase [Sesamum angolense]|uniref:GDSL esterase/lipase n=1 Tax=Sesamum angolense TaxID=2727404 RepID=A0AAE1WQV7_9LAMI|nr:GDSL esterase/lipase [Sesamum angolense]